MKKNVSLELAKEFKEAGYSGECEKYYVAQFKDGQLIASNLCIGKIPSKDFETDEFKYYLAPDAIELLEELPAYIEMPSRSGDAWFKISKTCNSYIVGYRIGCAELDFKQEDKNLANALAKLWLNLRDNKII